MMRQNPEVILSFKGALTNASADAMNSGGETEASHKSAEVGEVASHSQDCARLCQCNKISWGGVCGEGAE